MDLSNFLWSLSVYLVYTLEKMMTFCSGLLIMMAKAWKIKHRLKKTGLSCKKKDGPYFNRASALTSKSLWCADSVSMSKLICYSGSYMCSSTKCKRPGWSGIRKIKIWGCGGLRYDLSQSHHILQFISTVMIEINNKNVSEAVYVTTLNLKLFQLYLYCITCHKCSYYITILSAAFALQG